MAQPVFLTTTRLIVREFAEGDLQAFHALASDPDVVQHLAFEPTVLPETQALIDSAIAAQRTEPRTTYALAIIEQATGALIGSCGVEVSGGPSDSAEIYYVLRKTSWGNGYATEATKAVINHGFEVLKLHRIWAHTAPDHHASIRVMEKAGMIYEGLTRGVIFMNGAWQDAVQYAILDTDPRDAS